jgi:hypothetical protein
MVHQIHKLLEQLKLIPGQNMEVQKLLFSFIGWNYMHLVWLPCISCMEFRPPWSDFHTLAWKSDSSIPAWCGSAPQLYTILNPGRRNGGGITELEQGSQQMCNLSNQSYKIQQYACRALSGWETATGCSGNTFRHKEPAQFILLPPFPPLDKIHHNPYAIHPISPQ